MTIYHVTSRANLKSILQAGLDPARARGKLPSVWGVTRSRVTWAIVHVLAKPWHADLAIRDLVVITITLPRTCLRRYRNRIWFTRPGQGPIPVTRDMVAPAGAWGKVAS